MRTPTGIPFDHTLARWAVGAACLALAGATLAAPIVRQSSPGLPTTAKSDRFEAPLTEGFRALQRGDLAAASAAFDKVLKEDPSHINATLGLAEAELKAGRSAKAEGLLKRALEYAPADPDVLVAYARFHSTHGRFDEALALLQRATGVPPGDYSALRDLGDLQLNAYKKPAAAIQAYRQALALRPDAVAPRVGIALALLAESRPGDARAELEQAARQAPGDPMLPHMIGRIEASEKRFQPALAAMDRALTIDPGMAAALSDRGDIHAELGQNKQAAADYETLVKLVPGNPTALLKLGMVYQRLDRLDDARQRYLEALALKKDLAVAYNNLASIALRGKKEPAQAHAWAKRAVELAPDVPHFQDTLGQTYRATGNTARAIEALSKASALNPAEPEFQFHLGQAYEDAGRPADAREAYRRALAMSPDFPQAAKARERMAALGR